MDRGTGRFPGTGEGLSPRDTSIRVRESPEVRLLSEYFHPEPASTAQLMTELAAGLQQEGFDVHAYTAQPTYQGQDREKLSGEEKHRGVDIHRIDATRFDKSRLFLRVVNWLTYCLPLLMRLTFSRSGASRVNLIVTTPPVLPLVGWCLYWLRGDPFVVVEYDVYPDVAVRLGIVSEGSPLVRVWDAVHRTVLGRAEAIVALDENMRELLVEKVGEERGDRVRVIPNWEDPDFIQPVDKENNPFAREHGYDEQFTLLYSGNHGLHHDLETVIRAASKLEDRPVQFVMIGEGARKGTLVDWVEREGLTNVDFHAYQPRERLPKTLTCADVSIVSEDPRVRGVSVSCKLYSSLASGQALLGISASDTEIDRVLRESGAGFRISPGDAAGFVDRVEEWLGDPDRVRTMGNRARAYFLDHFTVEHAVRRYGQLLRRPVVT